MASTLIRSRIAPSELRVGDHLLDLDATVTGHDATGLTAGGGVFVDAVLADGTRTTILYWSDDDVVDAVPGDTLPLPASAVDQTGTVCGGTALGWEAAAHGPGRNPWCPACNGAGEPAACACAGTGFTITALTERVLPCPHHTGDAR